MHKNQCIKLIENELLSLGLTKGDIVLVHISNEWIKKIEGGAESFIKGILGVLESEGTLLVPTGSCSQVDGVNNDTYSVKDTPAESGELPEYFRKLPGVIRSVNPTHSVCGIGKYAKDLLSLHHLDETPCGKHSPYNLLHQLGGKILFIGCGFESNIMMHAVEESLETVPEYLQGDKLQYKIYNGTREKSYMYCQRYNLEDVKTHYEKLEDAINESEIQIGTILKEKAKLIQANIVWKKAKQLYQKDLWYFADKES